MFIETKLAAKRALGFFADRVNYQDLKFNFNTDWTKYYWSLQTNFTCNYDCPYCVQGFGLDEKRKGLPSIKAPDPEMFLKLNRLEPRFNGNMDCLHIQGGEPLLYKRLPFLVQNLKVFKKIVIVTNLSFDVEKYISLKSVNAEVKFIGSFHKDYQNIDVFLKTASILNKEKMLEYCNSVDERWKDSVHATKVFQGRAIPFRTYRFVGAKNNLIYPKKATEACSYTGKKNVLCSSAIILLSPDGNVYNCHAKMYRGKGAVCSLDDFPEKFSVGYLPCDEYGYCQPCQVNAIKIKHL